MQTEKKMSLLEGRETQRLPAPLEETAYTHASTIERAKYFAISGVAVGGLAELIGMGPLGILLGIVAGATAAVFSEELRSGIVEKLPSLPQANNANQTSRLSRLQWFIAGDYNGDDDEPEEDEQVEEEDDTIVDSTIEDADEGVVQFDDEVIEDEDEQTEHLEEDIDIFSPQMRRQDESIARLTVDDIVAHTERNSFMTYIGRSLTKPGNTAVQIGIYKRHFKFIGASQKGKSSMAAAFLDIVTRTHDPRHVQIALLDMEDQTSNLFAHLPHLVQVKSNGQVIRLHARTREQVLEYLGYLVQIMNYRYSLSKLQIATEPVILAYVEEFIALKDYFKRRISTSSGEAKDEAKQDYENLIFAISEIARRGLKVRVQFLLCAQVDYRDDDLQEALINITSGASFCVRPTAAQAAGFYQTELIKRNFIDNRVGQFVAEMPDVRDLVLAPDYDLERMLTKWEQVEGQREAERRHREQFLYGNGRAEVAQRQTDETLAVPPERLTSISETPVPPQPSPIEQQRERHERVLHHALTLWNAGNSSRRLLAKAMDCKESQAQRIMDELEERELIKVNRKSKIEDIDVEAHSLVDG